MNHLSRRRFIRNATVAGAAMTLPRFSIGKPGANSRINVALIGGGGMFLATKGEQVELTPQTELIVELREPIRVPESTY